MCAARRGNVVGPAQALGEYGVHDMITLNNLTEETILKNVQRRFAKNIIYVRRRVFAVGDRGAARRCGRRARPETARCGARGADLHWVHPGGDEPVPDAADLYAEGR